MFADEFRFERPIIAFHWGVVIGASHPEKAASYITKYVTVALLTNKEMY
ncbi:hypothetical protein [Bacteroides acidifaciens]|nr:hypothetical protein [Bacteroides acidifaciens]